MHFRPLKSISTFFTVFIIILSFPATAIMASWNSIPGSILYPAKRGLEKVALALVPNSFFESELRLKLLDRRTTEVVNSIIKSPGNTESLNELIAEAQAAEFVTVELDPKQRAQATTRLIHKLTQTSQQLETVKNNLPNPPASDLPDDQPKPFQDKIEDTQDEIEEIIEELEEFASKASQSINDPTDQGNNEDPNSQEPQEEEQEENNNDDNHGKSQGKGQGKGKNKEKD